MKIYNINDVNKFFEVVDKCKGKVELVTGEGDRLNLKSKLCQYVALADAFSNGTIPEMELVAYPFTSVIVKSTSLTSTSSVV